MHGCGGGVNRSGRESGERCRGTLGEAWKMLKDEWGRENNRAEWMGAWKVRWKRAGI